MTDNITNNKTQTNSLAKPTLGNTEMTRTIKADGNLSPGSYFAAN